MQLKFLEWFLYFNWGTFYYYC